MTKKILLYITIFIMLCIPSILISQTVTIFSEDFENGGAKPPSWTITTIDPTNWLFTTNSSRYIYKVTKGPGDYAAVADSDLDGGTMDTWLITSSINCSDYTNIILQFHHRYQRWNELGTEGIYIYIATDGVVDTNDTVILFHNLFSLSTNITNINISSVADRQSDVKISFRYKANYDMFWIIDDVIVTGILATTSTQTQQTQQTQETSTSEFINEQEGEKDVIIGRNKIHTSKNEQVLFHCRKSSDITIYSSDGRKIKKFKVNANDTATWPGTDVPVPGVYIASIKIEGRDETVIKQILVLR